MTTINNLRACISTLPDFLDAELPQNTAIAGPLSAGELAIIASPTGFGKTWLAMGLYNALLCGKDFLYFKIDKPARVLHIDGEMHAAKLQARLNCFEWKGIDDPTLRTFGCQYTFRQAGEPRLNLADPEHQQSIIKAASNFDVIIFDNVYSLVNVEGMSMASDQFWVTVMELNMTLRDMNKLVLWFDHTNSAGQVFGTKTKEWQVDYVGLISRSRAQEKNKLQFDLEWTKHRALNEYPKCVRIEMHTQNVAGWCEWSWKEIQSGDEQTASIITMLEMGQTYGEICHDLGVSRQKIAKIKKEYGIK